MRRVFLDANVLFSAALKPHTPLLALWSLSDVELVASLYVTSEARRNLADRHPDRVAVLDDLLTQVSLVPDAVSASLPSELELSAKDVPVLLAAIDAGCTHLITGNTRHFAVLYGKTVSSVLVQTPVQFLGT